MKLPGKSGVERLLEMRSLRPAARIVLITGFNVQPLIDEAVAQGAYRVLQKPLDMKYLREMLAELSPGGH